VFLPEKVSKKRIMYYIRIWHPDKREYTIMKSAGVIAETLGIDTADWPPSTKAGARYIASEWMKAGGKVKRKDEPAIQSIKISCYNEAWEGECSRGS
jgi:hypothetical protein